MGKQLLGGLLRMSGLLLMGGLLGRVLGVLQHNFCKIRGGALMQFMHKACKTWLNSFENMLDYGVDSEGEPLKHDKVVTDLNESAKSIGSLLEAVESAKTHCELEQ